jgi:pilus assembly protein TadC
MTFHTAALLALGGALLAWSARGAPVHRRARALRVAQPAGSRQRRRREPRSEPRRSARRRLLAAAGGIASAALLGGLLGLVAGAGVAVVTERLLRRAEDTTRAESAELVADLPVACDLLAVCLGAGVPFGAALHAVGAAVAGPVGGHLVRVAALHRLGAESRQAWTDVPPELAALGRVVVRAGESGARAVPSLQALAAEGRASGRAATEAAVRRAGVWVLAPLGACFLPAFVCLGVVPLILGIAGQVFG